MIFPWAAGGNLGNYWENYGRKSRERDSLQWIFDQFVGISSALEELHENNCRHNDLKPENILWFKDNDDKGTLQIADLGLAAFHEKEADTKQRHGKPTETPSGTSRYEPPEMDQNRDNDGPRSRQYDIWSMGCIMLELLVWLIYGCDAVKSFRKNTAYFWDRKGQEYRVHTYVVSRMEIMASQLQADTAYKHLLDLVRDRLLVVPLSGDYESAPECREIARVLHVRMKAIQRSCLSDPSSTYLSPVQLEYSSPQPGTVYQNDRGLLAPPDRTGLPKSPRPSLPPRVSGPMEDGVPILVRAPTLVEPKDPPRAQSSGTADHQEVGGPNP